MTLNHLGRTAQMGPLLQAEVEKQLIEDLEKYNLHEKGLSIDWLESCQEGHCTSFLDGNLENLSCVVVRDQRGNQIAEGWIDFIHGGNNNPLFVFWLFLSIHKAQEWMKVKDQPVIPIHIWNKLPETTKKLCSKKEEYDARWSKDPLVQEWGSGNII